MWKMVGVGAERLQSIKNETPCPTTSPTPGIHFGALAMQRIKYLLLSVFALLLTANAQAQPTAEPFKEGTHYQRIADQVRPRDPAKIEVVEVFQYGCPHCYRFEPLLTAWRKTLASDVDFYQLPVIWNGPGQLHAQAFFAAQALGVLNKTHEPMFAAIHEQGNPLNSKEKIQQIFATAGVTADQFDKAFDSFGVTSQINQAKARALSYKIEGTPELIVAGKYRIDGRAFAGSNMSERDMHQKMLQIADFLIAKERQQKTKK
jgi:thiol:disulfide interchange protein DsbA